MKPITLVIGALTIAIAFGTGGYLLGSRKAGDNTSSAAAESSDVRSANRQTASREAVRPQIDIKSFKSKLDAEQNPLARFKLAMQNLEAWVDANPQEAMAWLLTQQPSDRRDEVMRMALSQFAARDPKGAADWASKNLTGTDLNNSLITIAENWAEQNGAEAATWFLSLAGTPQRNAAVEGLFFAWASNEPAAALDFLKSKQDLGELSPILQRATLAGWAKSDPANAVNISLQLSRTNSDPGLFANTLANWATLDLEGSSNWMLGNLKAGPERAAAIPELATIYAQQSPDAGVAWLGKLEAGTERDSAASALAATWARSDAAAAAKWAAAQSSIKISPEAAAAVTGNFARQDPAAFEAWSAALPEGPLKTQAAQMKGPQVPEVEE